MSISENFLPIDRPLLSYGPYNTNNPITIGFQLLSATNQELMRYQIEIYSELYHDPILIDIGFANKKAFKSKFEVLSNMSSLFIDEDGFIELIIAAQLDVIFAGYDNWQSDEFTGLFIQNLESASCEISGTRTIVQSGDLGQYDENERINNMEINNCRIIGSVGDNGVLQLSSGIDWNQSTNGDYLDGIRGIFYKFEPTSLIIKFQLPILEDEEIISLPVNDFSQYENINENYQPSYDSNNCEGIQSRGKSLEDWIDWKSVNTCLDSMRDEDGLESVGLSITAIFEDNNRQSLIILCREKNSLPNSIEAWLDLDALENKGCSISGDRISSGIKWQEISVNLISCDSYCVASDFDSVHNAYVFETLENAFLLNSPVHIFYIGVMYILILGVPCIALYYLYRKLPPGTFMNLWDWITRFCKKGIALIRK